jgi:hypothetical protein
MGLMTGLKVVCGRAKCGWAVTIRLKKRATDKHKIEFFGRMMMRRII